MSDNYWVKRLTNGSLEVGTDLLIAGGEASWTKGSQEIDSVVITIGDYILEVFCNDAVEWKQFDRFVFSAGAGKTILMAREIKCRLRNARTVEVRRESPSTVNVFINPVAVGTRVPAGTEWISIVIEKNGHVFCECSPGEVS